jgi:hypothetical protein
MNRRTTFLTASVIAAVVFAGSTPARAADLTAVKRAIVITVLNNLGVRPTEELIDALVNEIPMDALDSGLVRQVGEALDSNGDASQIIGELVDSDGDGVPDEDGATDSSSDDEDEDEADEDEDSDDEADEDEADEDEADEDEADEDEADEDEADEDEDSDVEEEDEDSDDEDEDEDSDEEDEDD